MSLKFYHVVLNFNTTNTCRCIRIMYPSLCEIRYEILIEGKWCRFALYLLMWIYHSKLFEILYRIQWVAIFCVSLSLSYVSRSCSDYWRRKKCSNYGSIYQQESVASADKYWVLATIGSIHWYYQPFQLADMVECPF